MRLAEQQTGGEAGATGKKKDAEAKEVRKSKAQIAESRELLDRIKVWHICGSFGAAVFSIIPFAGQGL